MGLTLAEYQAGMSRHQPMDKDAAARIQSAADRHPDCASAQTDFDRRAQSAADKSQDDDTSDDD